MGSSKKILLICVVVFLGFCSANLAEREGQACYVQYLKDRGKLNEEFISPAPFSSQCRLLLPDALGMLKYDLKNEIKEKCPNEAGCLTREFENQESIIDYLLKVVVIKCSKWLSDSDKDIQLGEIRNQSEAVLQEMAVKCRTPDDTFLNTFRVMFRLDKNSVEREKRLNAEEDEYCLSKYALDNQLLDLKNVDTNPHNIDPDTVDCDYIIYVERSKSEKELSDKLAATQAGAKLLTCVINAYRSGNWFNRHVIGKVNHFLDISNPVKERGTEKTLDELVLANSNCSSRNLNQITGSMIIKHF